MEYSLGKVILKNLFKIAKLIWNVLFRIGIITAALAGFYAFLYAVDLIPENMKELTERGLNWVDSFLE